MEKTTAIVIRSLIVVSVFLWFLSSVSEAATIEVDCSSATLQASVDRAKPGDTLLVSGTCKENLVIYEEVARITLDGQGKATINGPEGRPTITVRGRGITIKGFTVTGGRHGIRVIWGGQAVIDGNTVQGSAGAGIAVARNSSARITNNTVKNNAGSGIGIENASFAMIMNNTVENNRRNGITVTQNSAALVGVLGRRAKTPNPNIIENNGLNGITVTRASSARIAGNTIRNNKRNGINVTRVSSAHISSNTIDGNGRNGITVTRNSQVATRSGGSKISREPNSTTSNNSGAGIRCASGSAVEGQLGSLNGNKGAKDVDSSCVGSLKP